MELQMCFGQRIEQGAVLGPQSALPGQHVGQRLAGRPGPGAEGQDQLVARVTIPFCKAINPNSRSRDAAWRCGIVGPRPRSRRSVRAPALADHPGRAHASRPTFYDKRILGREQEQCGACEPRRAVREINWCQFKINWCQFILLPLKSGNQLVSIYAAKTELTSIAVPGRISGHDLLDHRAMHVGQAMVPSLVQESQPGVVDAQAMQQGGVQVVDVDRIPDDVVPEVVGGAVGDPGPDAPAGQPDGEAAGMVVAAVVVGRQPALAVDGSAELAAPDDQGLIEQPALLRGPGQVPRRRDRCRGTGR